MRKSPNRKPVRRGLKFYCTKAHWQDYLEVRESAVALAKQLGPGWRPLVWENFGWNCRAYYRFGYLFMAVDPVDDKFQCAIGSGPGVGNPGFYEPAFYNTPEAAVRACYVNYQTFLSPDWSLLKTIRTMEKVVKRLRQ